MRDPDVTAPAVCTHAPGDGRGVVIFQGVALLLAVGLLAAYGRSATVHTLSLVFVSIVLEALPFLLLGTLLSGLLEVFVPREKLAALLPARAAYTVLLAGLLGLVFPVCECAVVPVVRRLVRKGVPFSAAIAYLLAGPIVNPIVAGSTAVAYGFNWTVVLLRLTAGYGIAVAVGTIMGAWFTAERALLARPDAGEGCGDHCAAGAGGGRTLPQRLRLALTTAIDEFLDVGRFLVLGALLAGLLQSQVDRRMLLLLMTTPALSIGMMMALAVGLNLCSEADAFVAASFRGMVPLTAQLALMVLGPMLDIKLLFMYLGLFRRRAIVTLAGLTLLFVFGTMLTMQLVGGGGA